MANRQVTIGVGLEMNKSGYNELVKSLKSIQNLANESFDGMPKDIQEAVTAAKQLEGIMSNSWNDKLNTFDTGKLTKGIKDAYGGAEGLKKVLSAAGPEGMTAFNQVANAVMSTNLQVKTSNKLLNDMAKTFTNTIKWNVASAAMNKVSGSIQQAWGFTKNLDSSLNDIRIVTNKSADEMDRFAVKANAAAKALGKSTTDYTNASLIYYQQGLDDREAAARTETTLKAANVTGQSTAEVSEQLTAVWNGYKVSAAEAESYVDKLAAVAASTASDLEELSTGMSKVASAASSMGVDMDQLNAQLATIVSITRQAPESAGTALKTIFARMGDLELDGEDEFGVTLGEVSNSLSSVGIQILDTNGNLREMGKVIEEVGNKWNSGAWSDAEKQALAIDLAGKRQYNNLLALFDNWDKYQANLKTSQEAEGTLQQQNDIYMESMKAHLQELRTESERTYDILFNADSINGFIDALDKLLTKFNDFLESVGGGGHVLTLFGALATRVFSSQIAGGISNTMGNFQKSIQNAQIRKASKEFAGTVTSANYGAVIANNAPNVANNFVSQSEKELVGNGTAYNQLLANRINLQKVGKTLSEEQSKALSDDITAIAKLQAEAEELKKTVEDIPTELEKLGEKTESVEVLKVNRDNVKQISKEAAEAANNVETILSAKDLKSTKSGYDKIENARANLVNQHIDDNRVLQEEDLKVYIEYQTKGTKKYKEELEKRLNIYQKAQERVEKRLEKNDTKNKDGKDVTEVLQSQKRRVTEGIEQTKEELAKIEAIEDQVVNTERSLNDMKKYQLGLAEEQNEKTQQYNQVIDQINKKEQMSVQAKEKEAEAARRQLEIEKQIAQQNKIAIITKIINSLTTGVAILNAASNVLDTIADKSATAGDKLSSLAGGLSSAGTSIMMLPGVQAKAIGAGITVGGAVLNHFAKQKKREEQLLQERIENYEKAASDIKTIQGKLTTDISSLNVEPEWNYLSKGVSEYGENISLTAEEYERYKSISSQIADLVPSLVKGYTDEGQAIVDKNKSIQETIDLLNKERQTEIKNQIDSNKEGLNEKVKSDIEQGESEKRSAEEKTIAAKTNAFDTYHSAMGLTFADLRGQTTDEDTIKFINESEEKLQKAYQDYVRKYGSDLSKWSDEAIKEVQGTNEKITNELKDKGLEVEGERIPTLLFNGGASGFIKAIGDYNDALDDAEDAIDEANEKIAGAYDEINSQVYTYLTTDVKNWATLSQTAKIGIQNYVNNLAYADFDNALTAATDFVTKYQTILNSLGKDSEIPDLIAKLSDPSNFDTTQDWFDAINENWGMLIEKGFKAEDLSDLFDINIDEKGNPLLNLLNIKDEKVQEALDKLKEQLKNAGVDFLNDEDLANLFSVSDLLNANGTIVGGLDLSAFDDKQSLERAAEQLERINTAIKEAKTASSTFSENIKLLSEGLADFAENGSISEEQVKKLEEKFTELQTIADNNSFEYASKVQDLLEEQEKQEQTALEAAQKSLINEANSIQKRITELEKDTTKDHTEEIQSFRTKLEEVIAEITSTQIKLNVAIESDIDTDVYDTFDRFGAEIDEFSRLIKEKNEFTWSEIRQVIEDGNAAILQNCSWTTDGKIKLDEKAKETFIDAKRTEFTAEKKAKIEELKLEKEAVTARRDYLQAILDNATTAQKAELKAQVEKTQKALQNQDKAASTSTKVKQEEGQDKEQMDKTYYENAAQKEKDLTSIADKEAKYRVTIHQNELNAKENESSYTAFNRVHVEGDPEKAARYSSIAAASKAAGRQYVSKVTGGKSVNYDEKSYKSFKREENQKINKGSSIQSNYNSNDFMKAFNDFMNGNFDNYSLDSMGNIFQGAMGSEEYLNVLKNGIKSLDETVGKYSGAIAALEAMDLSIDELGKGKDSKSNTQTLDLLQKEKDIYHDINVILAEQETQLGRIQKRQEKLTGQDLINNLNEELALNKAINSSLKEKIRIAEGDASQKRKTGAKTYGLQFDTNGDMTNYFDVFDKLKNKAEGLTLAYNAATEEQQKVMKAQVEASRKLFENFESFVSDYTTLTTETIPGLYDDMQENLDKNTKLEIQKYEIVIKARLDVSALKRDWANFLEELNQLNIAEPNRRQTMTNRGTALKSYLGENGTLMTETNNMNTLLTERAAMEKGIYKGAYGDNFEEIDKAIETSQQNLQNDLKDFLQAYQDIKQNFLDSQSELATTISEYLATFDEINTYLEHGVKVYELLGKSSKEYYNQLVPIYEKQVENATEQTAASRKNLEYSKELLSQMKKGDVGYNEQLQQVNENIATLNKNIENTLTIIVKEYENAVDAAIKKFDIATFGALGLENAREEWETLNSISDLYLDNVHKTVELNKLNADLTKKISEATDLSVRSKLVEFQEKELKVLQEKEKLSKYDVEHAQKALALLEKRIALENAQKNSSTMRLRRDSQGNYNYQFAADPEEIAKQQQDLEQAQADLWDSDKQALLDSQQEALEAQKKYESTMADIYKNHRGEDGQLTEEGKAQQGHAEALYREQMAAANDKNKTAISNLREHAAISDYGEGVNKDNLEQVLPQLNDSTQQILNQYQEDSEGFLETKITNLNESLAETSKQIYDELVKVTKAAVGINDIIGGTSFSTLLTNAANLDKDSIEERLKNGVPLNIIPEAIEENQKNLKSDVSETYKTTKDLMGDVRNFKGIVEKALKTEAAAAKKAAEEAKKKQESQAKKTVDKNSSNTSTASTAQKSTKSSVKNGNKNNNNNKGNSGKSNNNNGSSSSSSKPVWERIMYIYKQINEGKIEAKGLLNRIKAGKEKGYTEAEVRAAQQYINLVYPKDKNGQGKSEAEAKKIMGYDTGGYTGNWGTTEGKLAFLHQKELVLNQQQTADMLAAMKYLNAIQGEVRSQMTSLSNAGNGRINAKAIPARASNTSATTINIHASFPNATDQREIEAAFQSLASQASMRAHSTQK